MSLVTVDLFCGCGGLSLGLSTAGMDVVAAYDNWSTSVSTYRTNIGPHASVLDLSDEQTCVEEIAKYEPDLIAGGPPCQEFSTAGKRVEGKQANLTVSFSEIVARSEPSFYLMENVPQVRNSDSYGLMKKRLRDAGYEIVDCVLNAALCGVPQLRKRFFSFGWREQRKRVGDRFLASLGERTSAEELTVKQYLKSDIDIEHYYRHPRNYSRRAVFSVHEPSPTVRGVNRPVPPNYVGNHLDSAPPSTVRPLTSRERGRIQTFPKSWDWGKRDRNGNVELQIGNAVPVNLASYVGRGIIDAVG